jgi:hypothetical protein
MAELKRMIEAWESWSDIDEHWSFFLKPKRPAA